MGFNDRFFVRPGVRKSEEDRIADAATTMVINAQKRTQREYERPPTLDEVRLYGRGSGMSGAALERMLKIGIDKGSIMCSLGNVPGNPSEKTYYLPGDEEGTLYNQTRSTFDAKNYLARKEFGAHAKGLRLMIGTASKRDHPRDKSGAERVKGRKEDKKRGVKGRIYP